jgi:hypothetical protein
MQEIAKDLSHFIDHDWYIIVGFILFLCLLEYLDEKRFERNMRVNFDYVPKPKRPYERRMENARSNINKINRHR